MCHMKREFNEYATRNEYGICPPTGDSVCTSLVLGSTLQVDFEPLVHRKGNRIYESCVRR